MDKTPKGPIKSTKTLSSKDESKLESINKLPSVSILDTAISLLENNKRVVSVETKDGITLSHAYDPEALRLGRSLLRPNSVYSFNLSKNSSLTSGSSVMQINIATDLTVYAEGATLAALFDEVKLRSTTLELALCQTGGSNFSYLIGFTPIVYTTTPTAAIVMRMPYSHIGTTNWPTRAGSSIQAVVADRTWGACTDEGVSTPRIVSGLAGTYSIANLSVPSSSQLYFSYVIRCKASFRNRG